MQLNMGFGSRMVSGLGGFFVAMAGLAIVPSAMGAPTRIQARQDNRVESYFTLDFGQGGVAQALISSTQFELEVDGPSGTARFLSYEQNVGSLSLPGGIETGAIHVQIVPGSSAGTYNRATGEFATDELYSIEFENDLSAFGLVSPVVLPSQSLGAVDVESTTLGRVTMNWQGQVLNSPSIPFDFNYICTLFATFSTTGASYIEAEMMPMLLAASMPEGLRSTLITYLDAAIASYNAFDVRTGSDWLHTFIFKLRRFPANVAQADANNLVAAANAAMALAENRILPVVFQTVRGGLNQDSADGPSKNESDRSTK